MSSQDGLQWFLNLIYVAAVAAIMIRGLCVINSMRKTTDVVIKLSFGMMTFGAFAALCGHFFLEYDPLWSDVVFTIGVSSVLIADRRAKQRQSFGAATQQKQLH